MSLFGKGKKKDAEAKTNEAKDYQEKVAEDKGKKKAKKNAPTPLTDKDQKKLAQNHYEQKKDRFPQIFVIEHKKTGKVVELHAASAYHAANLIGWRPRHVRLVKVKGKKGEPTKVDPAKQEPPKKEEVKTDAEQPASAS